MAITAESAGLVTCLLYGVTATDPATLVVVDALPVLVAVIACYIPTRRAMGVDPTVAMRHENGQLFHNPVREGLPTIHRLCSFSRQCRAS
jgi:hypothetical protein